LENHRHEKERFIYAGAICEGSAKSGTERHLV
jgi:hypothetical protein